ncbi:MAG: sulfatase [Acidimicrobiia bacterium]|nr:sulfatase [Acidimicrobiia bacterium]
MIDRRQFMASSLAAAVGAAERRPNVLFLSVDDMNDYGFSGAYPSLSMPNLRKFRETAIAFDRAYCPSPVCVPSRASIFSGLFPHTTGSYWNGSDPWDKEPLRGMESMPEIFQRNGYATFGRGKLFHAPLPKEREEKMWDNKFFGGGFGPFPPEKDQRKGRFWGWTPWEGPDTDFPDVVNTSASVDFLKQKQEKPFFLALGFWRPHTPFTAPKRFFDLYADAALPPGYKENDLADVPAAAKELAAVWGERFDAAKTQEWRAFVRAYLACTSFADWSCGRILDALDSSPYRESTIVMFWSDNGYHCGEKNHWEKNTLWEKSALTPMAIRIPGSKHAGKRCMRPVSLIDLYPTLVETCGLNKPKHTLEGRSLLPLLDKPDARWDRPALTTYGEHVASVRDDRYRYIRYADGSEELYDHSLDPHEWENLASKPGMEAVKKRLGKAIPERWAPSLGGRLG